MEAHKLEIAVGLTGLKMLLATTNPWLIGIGIAAGVATSVAIVGIVAVKYATSKAKDQEREKGDRK